MAATLASESAPSESELSLVFCDDPFIQDLNRQYRGKDCPTDVLSFPQDPASGILGDVVISVPTAQVQARQQRQSLERELEWLFLHGALHLLGHRDDTEEQLQEMVRKARAIQEACA